MHDIINLQVSLFASFFDNEPVSRRLEDVVGLARSEQMERLTLDIRHLRAFAANAATPVEQAIVAKNKADKMKRGPLAANVAAFLRKMKETWDELPPHFVTSSETRQGRDEVLDYIEQYC